MEASSRASWPSAVTVISSRKRAPGGRDTASVPVLAAAEA